MIAVTFQQRWKLQSEKYLSRELPDGARQYEETDYSTVGAAGDESEGDDLYIVFEMSCFHDNLGGTADYLDFRPICILHMGFYFFSDKETTPMPLS